MIYGELPLWMVITETNKYFHSTMIEGTKTIAGKVIPDHYITEPNKLLNLQEHCQFSILEHLH
jgi:hypothetical protein